MFYFFTDPHLGLVRSSHTTALSRQRLQAAIHDQVCNVIDRVEAPEDQIFRLFCLGDLFDRTHNPEYVLQQGLDVLQYCDWVLAGNHDLPNRDGTTSSFQLLDELWPDVTVVADSTGETGYAQFQPSPEGFHIYAIPHVANQVLFDTALEEVYTAALADGGTYHVLLLHCNYDNGFAAQSDNSLNLTQAQAEKLLTVFERILVGHEHQPHSAFSGRLQMLGNIFPTSFSDISAKYLWSLDASGNLKSTLIWSPAEHYLQIDWEDLPGVETRVKADQMQFIDVVGKAPAQDMARVAREVSRLWSVFPNALMIRNNVEAEGLLVDAAAVAEHRSLDVPDRITALLKDSPLLPLWKEFLENTHA